MSDTSWLEHPALKNLDARKLSVIIELINEAEGKPLEKTLPLLMNANTKLRNQDLSFSKDESSVIFDILTSNMSQEEKNKFNNIRNLMEMKMKSFKK